MGRGLPVPSSPARFDATSFFQDAVECFRQARLAAVDRPEDRYFDVAGRPVRVSFANGALIPTLIPALAHLETAPVAAQDLTINVMDEASTGVSLPPGPWPRKPAGAESAQWTFGRGGMRFYSMAGEAVSLMDLGRATAFYCVPDAARTPWYEGGSPFRALFQWWASTAGRCIVHAGAVGTERGAALIGGRGGSGKSTTCLTGLVNGLHYLGDDYVIIGAEPSPRVFSLYRTAKLNLDSEQRFPELAGARHPAGKVAAAKTLIYLPDRYRRQIRPELPLKALILPRIAGGSRPALRRLSPALAAAALAPSSVFQLPGSSETVFGLVAALARKLPAFVLELNDDMSGVPDLIREVVE